MRSCSRKTAARSGKGGRGDGKQNRDLPQGAPGRPAAPGRSRRRALEGALRHGDPGRGAVPDDPLPSAARRQPAAARVARHPAGEPPAASPAAARPRAAHFDGGRPAHVPIPLCAVSQPDHAVPLPAPAPHFALRGAVRGAAVPDLRADEHRRPVLQHDGDRSAGDRVRDPRRGRGARVGGGALRSSTPSTPRRRLSARCGGGRARPACAAASCCC